MKFVDTANFTSVEDVNDYLDFSEAGYLVLTIYHTIALLVGLVGNILVLYGSVKFNAVAVDNISIVLVEALAVSDLLVLGLYMLSMWVTLVTRRWVLGTVGCFIQGMGSYVCCSVEMSVIMAISCYRFHTLHHPLSALTISPRHAKIFVVGVSVFSVVYFLCFHLIGDFYYFDPYWLCCQISGLTGNGLGGVLSDVYVTVAIVLFIVLPLLVIVATNIGILLLISRLIRKSADIKACTSDEKKSRRISGIPDKSAIVTVSCVAWTFSVSITPMAAMLALQVCKIYMPPWYDILAMELQLANSIANPVIYTITNCSFRSFMCKIFRGSNRGKTIQTPSPRTGVR